MASSAADARSTNSGTRSCAISTSRGRSSNSRPSCESRSRESNSADANKPTKAPSLKRQARPARLERAAHPRPFLRLGLVLRLAVPHHVCASRKRIHSGGSSDVRGRGKAHRGRRTSPGRCRRAGRLVSSPGSAAPAGRRAGCRPPQPRRPPAQPAALAASPGGARGWAARARRAGSGSWRAPPAAPAGAPARASQSAAPAPARTGRRARTQRLVCTSTAE